MAWFKKAPPDPTHICVICGEPIKTEDRAMYTRDPLTYYHDLTLRKPCGEYQRALSDVQRARLEEIAREHESKAAASVAGVHATPWKLDANTRNRHMYVLGKTRSGKTVLLKSLVLGNFDNGDGIAYIDPHGEAVYDLAGHMKRERIDDVIYFDPSSPACPSFNLLALPYEPAKLTEDVLSAFKMFYGDSWGPRLEHLLRFSIRTLLADEEPHSLLDLQRLLLEPDYRTRIAGRIRIDRIRQFWEMDYPTDAKSSTNAVLNKLSAVLAPESPLERLFSNPRNDLDFPAILDERKILLCNLSKGAIGDAPSRLLGGLITTGIQQAALARGPNKPDFYFYVDEFHNYTVASFETILAESAKYRLNLTLANQTLAQLPSDIQHAILGNVGTIVAFQISSEDAPRIAKEIRTQAYLDPQTNQKMLRSSYFQQRFLQSAARIREQLAAAHVFPKTGPRWKQWEYDQLLKILASPNEPVRDPLAEEGEWQPFPTPADFTNLQTCYALARVGTPENVCFWKIPFPSAPNDEIRAAVLERNRERYSRAAPAPKRHSAPEPAPVRDEPQPVAAKKYSDDDFSF